MRIFNFIRLFPGLKSICYEGGYTLIEDDEFKPKKGRLVVFPSKKMNHGVSLVKGKSRYTYIAWWKEK